MTIIKFWQRISDTPSSDDSEDVRREIVASIVAMMWGLAWLDTWAAIHYRGWGYFFSAIMLVAGAMGSTRLRAVHLRGSIYVILLTLTGVIVCLKEFFPYSLVQYYFPIIVIISGLLESYPNLVLVAAFASVTCVCVARLQDADWYNNSEIVTPNILIYLSAFTTWLSARQLLTAFHWMGTTYTQTRQLLEQLRDERASMASTLKQLKEAYERIEKMNSALMEARSVAEESRRLKAEFAANISHELRTPLNIIIGFSETIANAPETYRGVTWSPTLRGDVEQIYQSSRHLLSLIDDILDLTALDMHRLGLTIEETNLETVIAEAIAVVQDLFRAKQLYLRAQVSPDLPMLRIDTTRIRQVLINLLTNASRFTVTGGVTITAMGAGRAVQVAVADTGIGIAPQDIQKVFDEFGQVDSSLRRKHEGFGLGVPLSKRLIELHNGRMWLESQPGQGSTFYFTLPAVREIGAKAELASTGRDVALPPGRKTVLMMEPDMMMLHIVRRHLNGCEVVEVIRQADLPALIEQYQPIALIMDRQGEVDIARATIASEIHLPQDLPVITIRLPSQLRSAQTLGARDFLIKPVMRDQLVGAIDGLGQSVRSVLIVDDDPSLVELVCRMLQAGGNNYNLLKALGGAEALALLRNESVDLVLLDWLMPEFDGLFVLREMKETPGLAHIPVIVISSEFPELAVSNEVLDLRLFRSGKSSVTEIVSLLEALVGVLPPRGLPDVEAAPAQSVTQSDPPVS